MYVISSVIGSAQNSTDQWHFMVLSVYFATERNSAWDPNSMESALWNFYHRHQANCLGCGRAFSCESFIGWIWECCYLCGHLYSETKSFSGFSGFPSFPSHWNVFISCTSKKKKKQRLSSPITAEFLKPVKQRRDCVKLFFFFFHVQEIFI